MAHSAMSACAPSVDATSVAGTVAVCALLVGRSTRRLSWEDVMRRGFYCVFHLALIVGFTAALLDPCLATETAARGAVSAKFLAASFAVDWVI